MTSKILKMSLLMVSAIVIIASVSVEENIECRNANNAFTVCETESALQSVTQIREADTLNLSLDTVSSIAANAFKNLRINNLRLDFGGEYSDMRNVTLVPESFLGLSSLKNLTITHAMFPFSLNPFRHLRSLTDLSILFSVTYELPAEFLSSFPNLRSFTLTAQALNEVTTSTFSQSSQNLERLSFSKGFITKIQPRSFERLHRLKHLGLSSNPLTNLEPGTFDGLDELEELNLSWTGASIISTSLFNGLLQLKYLKLSNNFIRDLEPGVFDGLEKLERLSLASNKLSGLPRGVFNGLKGLKLLDIRGNKISVIHNNVFNGLTNLQELRLGANAISIIEVNAFSGLHLKILSLYHNRPLSVIRTDMFHGLDVIELNLYNPKPFEVKPNAFRGAKIRKLVLSENQLKQVNKTGWGLDESVQVGKKK